MRTNAVQPCSALSSRKHASQHGCVTLHQLQSGLLAVAGQQHSSSQRLEKQRSGRSEIRCDGHRAGLLATQVGNLAEVKCSLGQVASKT